MTISPPKYTNWFSFGNILTVVFGAITAMAMFIVMDERSKNNLTYITELRKDLKDVQDDVGNLEKAQARSDERFSSILGLLEKIDTRLERIEAHN